MKINIDKRLYKEINWHLANDFRPSQYLNSLREDSFLKYPFIMLNKLKHTEQSLKYHPEGNVWNHTMLVVDNAALRKEKSSNSQEFMWAALLHDIGKPDATKVKNGKITSYDHDKIGAQLANEFLQNFSENEHFIKNVTALVRWHMQILFVINQLKFVQIEQMKNEVLINDIALLGLCDRLGRLGADEEKEQQNIKIFLYKCKEKNING